MKNLTVLLGMLLSLNCATAQVTCYGSGNDSLTFEVVIDTHTCPDSCNGEMHVNILAGSGNYSVSWMGMSGSNNYTGQSVTNMCYDDYNVQVLDNTTGIVCSDIASFATSPISSTINVTDVTNTNPCDGEADLDITGGVPPYTVYWYDSNQTLIPNENDTIIDSLCIGWYFYSISDSYNCPCPGDSCIDDLEDASGNLLYPPDDTTCYGGPPPPGNLIPFYVGGSDVPLVGNWDFSMESCFAQCNGYVQVSAQGGVEPYIFNFPAVGMSNSTGGFSGVCPGSYTIQVEDALGNTDDIFVDVYELQPIIIQPVVNDESCLGECDGSINYMVSGGMPPYQFDLMGVTSQSSSLFDNLCPGSYDLYVYDSYGCDEFLFGTVVNPGNDVQSNLFVSGESYAGQNDGSIQFGSPTGGNSPYSYSITGPVTQSNGQGVFTGLPAGTYIACTVDALGCERCDTAIIDTGIVCNVQINGVVVNPSCNGNCDGEISVTTNLTNPTYSWNMGATTSSLSGLCATQYCVTVQADNGCVNDSCFNITEPAPIQLFVDSVVHESVSGNMDGSIALSVIGGNGDYTFSLDNGSSSNTGPASSTSFTGLGYGWYVACVEDSSACEACDSVYVDADEMTGMYETSLSNIRVYPNPNNGIFYIDLPGGNSYQVDLYDLSGRMILSEKFGEGGQYILKTDNNVSTGMYALIIKTEEGIRNFRLVVQ